jgi:hypothetical protein
MDITFIAGPNTVISDCESLWTAGAGVTATQSADKQVGTYSAKFACTSAVKSGAVIGYETWAAKNLSTARYFSYWIKSSKATVAGDVQILLVEGSTVRETINVPALVANTWKWGIAATTNPATDNAITTVRLVMAGDVGAFDLWVDHITCYITKTFTPLSVKGFDEAEQVVMHPATTQKDLVGNITEWRGSFNRVISVDLGVVTEKIDRIFLLVWALSETKQITYAGETIGVVLSEGEDFGAEWKNNISFSRAYSFELIEKTARRTMPTSWLDY